jgi:hypothetical protein
MPPVLKPLRRADIQPAETSRIIIENYIAPRHRTIVSCLNFSQKTSPKQRHEPMATDSRGNNDPIIMTARLGFQLLIPVLVCAFAGCQAITRPSVGASAGAEIDTGPSSAPGPASGPDSSQSSQNIPQSESNAPATTTDSDALRTTKIPDGIARIHGRYYTLRNGKATHLDQKQRFTEGLYFEHGGRIVLSDGNIVRLHDGEMVTFGGERREVPWNIQLPKLLPPGSDGQTSPL